LDWISVSRQSETYSLTYPGLASFTVSRDGRQVICHSSEGTSELTIRHLLLDQVLPLVLSRQGASVFHGSAVALPSGAAVFIGKSGQGKSTLAGFFARQGFPLLADDCIVFSQHADQLLVHPAYPGVRLWGDSLDFLDGSEADHPFVMEGRPKRRFAAALQFAPDPVPLRRFYFLTPSATPEMRIEKLIGADVVRHMLESQFVLDPQDEKELRTSFEGATSIARTGLCYRLSIPRDYARLAESADQILRHAATP